ncbi:DUF3299 domain-containing protein [Pseudomonas sp. CFBP 8758]|uniref:DUF3299 domain-containing protein n=1 Tax=Pseudomonas sp. CFBP 8758 TaxID=2775286 RepID=UPI0017809628|nr:DUF3299 domain-containing protein [Pseudomonas sp. CFBP 8758]MBD8594055.1 DUF3299 domain-containing protein [Pseudomonas sp. CFBP 8758]
MLRAVMALLLLTSMSLSAAELKEVSWEALIPPDAPKLTPQMTPMHDLAQMGTALAEAGPAAHQQAPDAPVVQALDGQRLRIPGYIVPLEVNEAGRTTEFLLVPYFGACIHVPPPPSNQIVHVTSAVGVKVEELYQPYWIEGPMQVKASTSDLAQAGYQMAAAKIYAYELPD